MMELALHYKEEEGLDGLILEPFRMMIRFGGKIPWSDLIIHFPFDYPYDQLLAEDYDNDEVISMTIQTDELLINREKPDCFGIYLLGVIKRLERMKIREQYDFDYNQIRQFIIRLDDLEEVLRFSLRPFYIWR